MIYIAGFEYPNGEGKLFVRCYDRYGNWMWERVAEDALCTGMIPSSILLWGTSVYVAGGFRGEIDFYPEGAGGEHNAGGNYRPFILKLSKDAEYDDSVMFDGGRIYCAAFDPLGNLFVGGSFYAAGDFDPDPVDEYLMTPDGTDGYVSTFTSTLDFDQAFHFGKGGEVWVGSMILDPFAPSMIVGGAFEGTDVDFDPGVSTALHTSVQYSDCFLAKYHIDGIWLNSVAWGDTGSDSVADVQVSPMGQVFVTSSFQDTCDIDWGAGEDEHTTLGSYDLVITETDMDLNYIKSVVFGSNGNDYLPLLRLDDVGNVYVSGIFDGTEIDLDPGPGVENHVNLSGQDIFTSKFDNGLNFLWGNVIGVGGGDDGYMGMDVYRSEFVVQDSFLAYAIVEMAPVDAPCNEESDMHGLIDEDIPYFIKYMSNGCWLAE